MERTGHARLAVSITLIEVNGESRANSPFLLRPEAADASPGGTKVGAPLVLEKGGTHICQDFYGIYKEMSMIGILLY